MHTEIVKYLGNKFKKLTVYSKNVLGEISIAIEQQNGNVEKKVIKT